MTSTVALPSVRVSTADLQTGLEATLCRHFGAGVQVVALQRRPSVLRSSFAIEELDVSLDDGTALPLIFKDLSWSALHHDARLAKPRFLYNPLREVEAYRRILPPDLGPTCYGAVTDAFQGRYWLFLERVAGRELYQCGAEVWAPVAAWLARMHMDLDQRLERVRGSQTTPLLQHDARYYRLWLDRARAFARRLRLLYPGKSLALDWLAQRYDAVVERLLRLPVTIIHGEFFPSNVLVRQTRSGSGICPVDWEMTGIGPALIDLAALVSGRWTENETIELALAYRDALAAASPLVPATDVFLANLDCCRLHVAVQQLGWSMNWQPPPRHAWNWVKEALELAEKLAL